VRKGAIFMLVAIGVIVSAVTTAIALFVGWLPDQASEQRSGIDFVFWMTTAICIGIFAIVASVIIYSVWKFRVRPDDDSDGLPIHGHTGLEIAWTAVPAVLVIIIGIASGIVLAQNDRASADALRVKVTAQQFAWSFEYPNGVTSGTLRLPVDRDVVLDLSARDVIHSFWVPQFGQKQDALPGEVTRLAITPTKIGEYPVICTELCGLGHSLMRTQTVVMEQGDFESWLANTGKELGGPPGEAGAAVFREQGCGSCHTFSPAGATAKIGPNLDNLKDDSSYVRKSIVDPNAVVVEGFQPNVMPKTFADLPGDQLDALVQYLLGASR
jgi:cytochrome c oxidase subunit II